MITFHQLTSTHDDALKIASILGHVARHFVDNQLNISRRQGDIGRSGGDLLGSSSRSRINSLLVCLLSPVSRRR